VRTRCWRLSSWRLDEVPPIQWAPRKTMAEHKQVCSPEDALLLALISLPSLPSPTLQSLVLVLMAMLVLMLMAMLTRLPPH